MPFPGLIGRRSKGPLARREYDAKDTPSITTGVLRDGCRAKPLLLKRDSPITCPTITRHRRQSGVATGKDHWRS